jgi:hypothetical protein
MKNVKRVFYYLYSTNDGSEVSVADSEKIFIEIVKGIVSLHPKPKVATPPPPPPPPKVATPPPPPPPK